LLRLRQRGPPCTWPRCGGTCDRHVAVPIVPVCGCPGAEEHRLLIRILCRETNKHLNITLI
jgi:hypothetical protein